MNEEQSWKRPAAPIEAEFAMPDFRRPVFPDRTEDIRDHGAVEGGEALCTEAFASAIAACAANGGGRVAVPDGVWLTGPIELKSNIELLLADNAEVRFSDRFELYLPAVEQYRQALYRSYSPLIRARDCENIAISGAGLLNGQGGAWQRMHWRHGGGEVQASARCDKDAHENVPPEQRVYDREDFGFRPVFIQPFNCRNVFFEGFRLVAPPCWAIVPAFCDTVAGRGLTILTEGYNPDGFNPNSCRNVLIEHCLFSTQDDAIAIKSGKDEEGRRLGRPSENIVVRHCRFDSRVGHGGIAIGSEMSGGVRNVRVHDCLFEGTNRALRIKSKRGRGGVVENIWIENIEVNNITRFPAIFIETYYGKGEVWDRENPYSQEPPLFRHIRVRHIRGSGNPGAIAVIGLPELAIEDVEIEDVRMRSRQGFVCADVNGIVLKDVRIEAEEGPAMSFDGVRNAAVFVTAEE